VKTHEGLEEISVGHGLCARPKLADINSLREGRANLRFVFRLHPDKYRVGIAAVEGGAGRGDHRTVDLDLQLSRSRSDVSGTYTLTITAADSCTTLADDVRSRSYTAAITQSGGELTVTLSGSQFATDHGRTLDQFKGFLEAERAVFRFSSTSDFYYYYFYTPDVLEFLATGRYYGFDGTAVTSLSRDQLAGTLNGTIGTFSGPPFRAALRCRSDNHRFVFSR